MPYLLPPFITILLATSSPTTSDIACLSNRYPKYLLLLLLLLLQQLLLLLSRLRQAN